jgi:hypothetical protein
MSDIKDIVKSWWSSFNPTEKQSKEGERRLEICMRCDSKKESIVFSYVCGECGCPLGKKIFSDVEKPCPLNKW